MTLPGADTAAAQTTPASRGQHPGAARLSGNRSARPAPAVQVSQAPRPAFHPACRCTARPGDSRTAPCPAKAGHRISLSPRVCASTASSSTTNVLRALSDAPVTSALYDSLPLRFNSSTIRFLQQSRVMSQKFQLVPRKTDSSRRQSDVVPDRFRTAFGMVQLFGVHKPGPESYAAA